MDFISLVFYFVVIVPSAIMHEYAHGWMADQLGDPTAKYAGRLSLDPRVHIDKWGTIFLPVLLFLITSGRFLFAYAKPVPYNPYNLKNQKWGPAMVAVAGPMANLILAGTFGLFLQFFSNSAIGLFFSIIVYANIALAIFNLVPIPPLDGSKILYALLPDSMWKLRQNLEQYGFFILIIFIFFFSNIIDPIIRIVYNLFTGGMGVF